VNISISKAFVVGRGYFEILDHNIFMRATPAIYYTCGFTPVGGVLFMKPLTILGVFALIMLLVSSGADSMGVDV